MISEYSVIKIVTSNDGNVHLNVASKKDIESYNLKVFNKDDVLVYEISNKINSKEFDISFEISNPNIWQLSNPYLYHYELDLGIEVINDTFGFRKISTSGKYITLNDTPLFIRGYIRGIEAHDHKNNCNLTEEEFYRKNIRTAKQFGFNFVRFHSTVPSETFFKVADEEGILVHIEMRPPQDEYDNVLEMVDSRMDFLDEEFIKDTSNRLFNHPSFAVYCLGNEFKNLADNEDIAKIGKMIKKMDPSRLYLDTCAWGENNRPLVDIDVQHMSYYFPFGKHADMYDDTNNLIVGDFNKGKEITFNVPLIAHEVCHYTALRDFKNLKEKYKKYNVPAPWWVDEELKMIHEKGYDERYPEMYQASKYFQRNSWKIAYEAMRSSKLLGGFMFLQFADTDKYENSNGVVDCFDDINGIEPKDFNIFNGDILLMSKLRKYNYYDTDKFNFDVFISRFDEQRLNNADLIITLGDKKQVFKDIDISKHDYYKLVSTSFDFDKVDKKTMLTLKFELFDKDTLLSKNEYNIWVYPELKKYTYKEFTSIKENDFIVTSSMEEALKALKEEKDAVLVYREKLTRHVADKGMKLPEHAFNASWNRFKPVIWDRGTNFGGIINTNELSKFGFNEKFLDLDLSILTEDSDKIILDDFPVKVNNLISGIDKSNRDRFDAYKTSFNLPELMYDRTLRDYSYLFETFVDGARLIVCGLNLTGLDFDEPSTNFMANSLLELIKSKKGNIPNGFTFEDFLLYIYNCGREPIKERIMTQFWELDDTPVETSEFWKESREYLTK